MKGKSLLIWIILLNMFDSSVCLTNVWLHKLLLELDAPFHCPSHTIWKFRLRFQQSNNSSGLHRDIWRKAEAKLCSNQTVTFGILLFTTGNCTLLSSYSMTLSLYLLERQSVGLDLKKSWNFHLPAGCGASNTTLAIDEVIVLNGARVHIGYENGSGKSSQTDSSLNKSTVLTDAILQKQSGLFENGDRRSKRLADDISPEEDDLRKGTVLKGDNKLFLEPFKESKSKLNYTQLRLLQAETKLDIQFLQAAFSIDSTGTLTASTRDTNESKDSLNNSNARIRMQLLDKTFTDTDGNKSENVNNTESTPYKNINRGPTMNHLSSINTTYISSTQSLPFQQTSVDSKSNTTTDLPVVESSDDNGITPKQDETSLANTKPSDSSHQTVTLTMIPFKTSTTAGMSMRTSGQPELSPLSLTGTQTDIITTTDLTPKESQNTITSHKTTESKNIASTLRSSATETSIITTISTVVKTTTSSIRGSTAQKQTSHPGQPKTQETMSNQNVSDDHDSTIITSPSETPTPTKTTTTMTPLSSSTMSKSPTLLSSTMSKTPTTTSLSSSTMSKTPTTTSLSSSTMSKSPTTTSLLSSSTTSKALMTTPLLSSSTTSKTPTMTPLSSSTTSKAPTMTSSIATSESSTRSSRLSMSPVTTSTSSDPSGTNVTPSITPSTNTSNSTLENEITTFLPHRTDKNLVQEEDDTYFWPVVLSLVIGIPAIIVFSIAMVVILKKRNIDSSTFFIGSAIGDEEV